MSELKELTYDIVTNAFIKALADIDKGTGERDKHFVAATELIIKNFKAHIEELDWPENPHKCYCNKYSPHTMTRGQIARDANYHGWEAAAKAFRKALMESLEEEKG